MTWNIVPKAFLPHASILATQQNERRRHVRFPVDVPAELLQRESKKRVAGIATNIGAGGCYVETNDTLPPGTRVELLLKFDQRTFRCRALVTYALTCTGIGMGVAFVESNLFDWLAHLSAESLAGSPDKIISGESQAMRGSIRP